VKTWTRVPSQPNPGRCGRCNRELVVGAPLLVLTAAVGKGSWVRCEACAGEPVPADLPPLEESSSTTRGLTPLRELIPFGDER